MDLTLNPQKITLADTNELEINVDNILTQLGWNEGDVLIDSQSAATQFNVNNQSISASSGTYTDKNIILPIKKGVTVRAKGSAAATFNIAIIRPR
jgi:hypothetical protein